MFGEVCFRFHFSDSQLLLRVSRQRSCLMGSNWRLVRQEWIFPNCTHISSRLLANKVRAFPNLISTLIEQPLSRALVLYLPNGIVYYRFDFIRRIIFKTLTDRMHDSLHFGMSFIRSDNRCRLYHHTRIGFNKDNQVAALQVELFADPVSNTIIRFVSIY